MISQTKHRQVVLHFGKSIMQLTVARENQILTVNQQ